MGPTIAAVGISFLLPLIVPKQKQYDFPEAFKQEIEKNKVIIISKAEQRLIDIVWILIFVLTSGWIFSLFISSTQPQLLWFNIIHAYLALGFANYFIGVLLSEIKELIQ
jgi:hypothetical protein